jgi:hypothetical protein
VFEGVAESGAVRHSQPAERVVQVIVDGSWREIELACDFFGGSPGGCQFGDSALLGAELGGFSGSCDRGSGGAEFGARPIGPGARTEAAEDFGCEPEWGSRGGVVQFAP